MTPLASLSEEKKWRRKDTFRYQKLEGCFLRLSDSTHEKYGIFERFNVLLRFVQCREFPPFFQRNRKTGFVYKGSCNFQHVPF
jgi:hypothetical protein